MRLSISRLWALALAGGMCFSVLSLQVEAVVFVNDDASPGGNGASWLTAYDNLQDALDAVGAGDEIWVAAGIYKPTKESDPGDPRSATFQLLNGVAVYGGFFGNENPATFNLDDRNLVANETVLNGDLNNDDGPNFLNNNENVYHVVTGDGVNSTAILDGFTISEGYANGSSFPDNGGAGICILTGSPTITKCTFTSNLARIGGAILCYNNSNPTVTKCNIIGNEANRVHYSCYGGGIYCKTNCDVTITDCTFSNNVSASDGGGIYCEDSCSLTITDSRFTENSGSHGGGIACKDDSSATILNCQITGNYSTYKGGGISCIQSMAVITDCVISENLSKSENGGSGGGIYFNRSNSSISNCQINNNKSLTRGGGIYCYNYSSPTIINSSINRNVSYEGGGIYCNSDCNPTIKKCVINENRSYIAGGIYCQYASSPKMINCLFAENVATSEGGGLYTISTPILIHCTLADNSATRGSQLSCGDYSMQNPDTLNIANCVLWGEGEIIRNDGNKIIDINYSDVRGGWPGEGNIDADPNFAFEDDYHLMPGSPCVDTATRNPLGEQVTADLDGNLRPLAGGGGGVLR